MELFKQKATEVIETLQAEVLQVPQELEFMESELRGEPIAMESKAWTHPKFRLIRYTRLYSKNRIDTFNFVIYPQDFYEAPIFASDFVVSGDKLRIGVIDAMPIFPQNPNYIKRWISPFSPLYQKGLALASRYNLKMDWSSQFLGDAATLATGVERSELPKIYDLWVEYLKKYLILTDTLQKVDENTEASIIEWHQRYNEAHLKVEDKRNPYMVYFGEEKGKRYNREFLFSNSLGK